MAPIEQTIELSLDRSKLGFVSVSVEYDLSWNVDTLSVSLPDEANVDWRHGFEYDGGGSYEYTWDGETAGPYLEVTMLAHELWDINEGAVSADTGDWALLSTPSVKTWYTTSENFDTGEFHEMSVDRTVTVDGEGVVEPSGLVYMGPYTEYNTHGKYEYIRLIVPEAASLVADPDEITTALAEASAALDVGARSDEVIAVAAPDRPINWGPGGRATGGGSFWVRDTVPLRSPTATWIHEYVHTRQDFWASSSASWIVEATAVFLAAQLGYETGYLDDIAYMRAVNNTRSDGVALGWPTTWPGFDAPYRNGANVAAWLDKELASLGDSTLADVIRRLNEKSGKINHETLLNVCTDLVTWKGDELAARIDDYLFSTHSPGRIVPRGVDKDPGETSISLKWNSSTGRIETNVEEAHTDIRHTSDDADDTDSIECGLCGIPFNGPDRCPECGYPDGD